MSSRSVLAIAQSGLVASSTKLETSAHNVANVNTQNFKPMVSETSDLPQGGVRVTISAAAREASARPPAVSESDLQSSGTDLATETTNQSIAVATYQANLKTIETQQTLDDTLMSMGR